MKAKRSNSKQINSTYKGYVLYDRDLNEKYFIESMNEIIGLHDVFQARIKDRKVIKEETNYNFDAIHAFDQVSFVSDVESFINKQPLNKPAEFKLIYFHNKLRGYFFRFNRLLFDEGSIKKFVQALEKQYFKGKYKQMGSSVFKDDISFYIPKSGQYMAKQKLLTFDEQLTKRIRAHIKAEDISLYQFVSGIVGAYFKVAKRKDINFETNLLQADTSIIGKVSHKSSYGFKKNPKLGLNEYIKNDYVELNKFARININMQDRYTDLQGNIFLLPSDEILNEIEFNIVEKDWEVELQINYQMVAFKKDDIFLMLSKLRMLVYEALENGSKAMNDIVLLTKKEEEIVKKFADPIYRTDLKSPYELFKTYTLKSGDKLALDSDKQYTYSKLMSLVQKYQKSLKKASDGEILKLEGSTADKMAMFLAADSMNLLVSETTGRIVKKGLFGSKLVGSKETDKLSLQYVTEQNKFSKEGYKNYTSWFRAYFNLRAEDRVHVGKDLFMFALPALVNGISVTENKANATMGVEASEDVKGSNLKHVVVFDKYISGNNDQKVYYAKRWEESLPIAMIGEIVNNRVKLQPVKGIGFLLFNKKQNLTQAFEKGNVFIHGPNVSTTQGDTVDFEGKKVSGAIIKQQGFWFLDGTLRL